MCRHADGTIEDYVSAAAEQGLASIGLSEHIPYPDDRWKGTRMDFSELDSYIDGVLEERRSHHDIEVFLGAECEWIAEYRDYYDMLLNEYGFHYLIGAPHWTPMADGSWLGYTRLSTPAQLRAYAAHVQDIIESKKFLFIAHPDVCFSGYARWDAEAEACSRDIIRCAKEHQVPLELNANGMRKRRITDWEGRSRRPYPLYEFWELAAEEGAEAVIGSDAHSPSDIIDSCGTCASWFRKLSLQDAQHRLHRAVRSRAADLDGSGFQRAPCVHTESL